MVAHWIHTVQRNPPTMDKRKDNKRKVPPFASFTSKDEPLIPVCCESDDEFFNNEDLPKKKLTPFLGQYRAIGKKNQEEPDKKRRRTTILMTRAKKRRRTRTILMMMAETRRRTRTILRRKTVGKMGKKRIDLSLLPHTLSTRTAFRLCVDGYLVLSGQ
jgi:hypothetical protein